MGIYSDLDDEELAAKIIQLRDAVETAAGGGVAVIAGEGRRMEYTRANSSGLKELLRAALSERDSRAGGSPDAAIRVVW